MPPTTSSLFFRWASIWESIGCRFWPHFAGVMVVEAKKEMYGVTPLWSASEKQTVTISQTGGVFKENL